MRRWQGPGIQLRSSLRRPSRVSSNRRNVGVPARGRERRGARALDPAVAPRVTDDLRIKRTALISKHDGAPPQIVVQQQAAHVVNVVGITVVRRIGGDNGFQCRRTAGGDLQAVEAAPALAHHADIAGAPRLAGNPVDHLECVVLFLLQIFVCHVAIGFAGAAHVHAIAAYPRLAK